MAVKSLGDRMKEYERVPRTKLMRRMPVIIRLDGKAFHTYTRGCDKPFDEDLKAVRQSTLKSLVNEIQGCVFGYAQSDEISLCLKDWQTLNTEAWFDNDLGKIVSISASLCTGYWNANMELREVGRDLDGKERKIDKIAFFDSRAWNLPREEVCNYFLWRQQDWERNSVQMLARSHYSNKQCHGINSRDLITKLEVEKGVVWGNLDNWQKQGSFYVAGEPACRDDFLVKNNREWLNAILDHTYVEFH